VELDALPYHADIAEHLCTSEAALWAWFESDQFSKRYAEKVKLELLKSTYRLTRDDQASVYELADAALAKFGLELPIAIYQRHGGGENANAGLIFLPDEVAVMLEGNIAELLSDEEMLAALGHEISHHRLYTLDDGRYFTAERLLEWCAEQPGCDASIIETGRLFRLHTEIFADRGALHVSGDRDTVISTLIKVSTGLKAVSARAYLEQADEILEKYHKGSEELTHPELYIRAKAVDILSGELPDMRRLSPLVCGPLDAKRLDLIGQNRLTALTRRVVDRVLAPEFMRNEYTGNLAERYFPGYKLRDACLIAHDNKGVETADTPDEHAQLTREIEWLTKSCHEILAFVLLDFATVDAESGDAALAWTLDLADQLGFLAVYEPTARKELKRKKDDLAKLKRAAAQNENATHA
jgi:hypothetical protein